MAPVRSISLLAAALGVSLLFQRSASAREVEPDPMIGGEAIRYDVDGRARLLRRSDAQPSARRQTICSDVESLRRRLGALSREDHLRFRRCQGLAN